MAAIVVSPFRHDARHDQELVDPNFARGLRSICDGAGAALILDDVRCGFRMAYGGSWEPIGVAPDLSAWSKAIANGYPLAAVLGNERFRAGAEKIFVTGSFWFSAAAMAAGLATVDTLGSEDALAKIERAGTPAPRRPGRAGLTATASRSARQARRRCRCSPSPVTTRSSRWRRSGPTWRHGARVLPPVAQLVPERGTHRRRHRRGPSCHRRSVRRHPQGARSPLTDKGRMAHEVGRRPRPGQAHGG
ncbi:MAG: aminotransferase class III-fold pyridoxal phosphate-dependent enzyme [Ilumatobacteraceae bacterium]